MKNDDNIINDKKVLSFCNLKAKSIIDKLISQMNDMGWDNIL